jgi:hypothetical protein
MSWEKRVKTVDSHIHVKLRQLGKRKTDEISDTLELASSALRGDPFFLQCSGSRLSAWQHGYRWRRICGRHLMVCSRNTLALCEKARWVIPPCFALLAILMCGEAAASEPTIPSTPKAAQASDERPERKDGQSGSSDSPSERVTQAETVAHPYGNSLSPEKVWTIFMVPALTLVALGAQVWIYSRQRKLMQAAIDMERPYVYGSVSKPGLTVAPSGTQNVLTRGTLELCIYNIGKTPANLTRLDYSISIAPHGGIAPAIDPAAVGGRELPIGTISVTGDPFFETEKLSLQFVSEESDIVNFKKTVWIVGFVRYADIFNRHHISGFALAFDPLAGRFVRRGGQKYNYARDENPSNVPAKSA